MFYCTLNILEINGEEMYDYDKKIQMINTTNKILKNTCIPFPFLDLELKRTNYTLYYRKLSL